MSNTVTVALTKPIKVKGAEVSELTFREAEMGDLIAGETVGKSNQTATIVATLASMAGISYPEAQKIAPRDFAKINEKVAVLLGNEEEGEAGTD
jgi:hypothetical protein